MHQLLWAGKTLGMALNRLLAIFQVFFFVCLFSPDFQGDSFEDWESQISSLELCQSTSSIYLGASPDPTGLSWWLRVKNPPAMQEPQKTRVWSLSQEDSLGKVMATHSSIPAWRIPWREKPGRLQFVGWQKVGHNRLYTKKFSWKWIINLNVRT